MISYHKGDLLESKCDIIAHQVNLQGVMGGGLARQIAEKYPLCEERYNKFCWWLHNAPEMLLGCVNFYEKENIVIANCFSQNLDFTTNYEKLYKCFNDVLEKAKTNNLKTIGTPKNYGCGIAHGDWQKVEQIFKDIFENEQEIELQIWELVQA